MEFEFFDANCMIGARAGRQPGGLASVAEVVGELARAGVRRALVYHALAREWAPSYGNAELANVLKRHPHLTGCWVAAPGAGDQDPAVRPFAERLLGAGCRAARLFPDQGAHRYGLSDAGLGALLGPLAAHRIPTFIDAPAPEWAALDRLLSDHPGLPVVLVGIGSRDAGQLFPLLARWSNLSVETSNLAAGGGIEELCGRYGPRRLLFGSGAPQGSIGAAVARVLVAELPVEAKAAIAGGNLERLIGGVRL
jgi:predicted TIM-barrel fold metal-dependent hydrolase